MLARGSRLLVAASVALLLAGADVAAQDAVLVQDGSPLRYLANTSDPGLGLAWTAEAFDDAAWMAGAYGIGYETGTGAEALIRTVVPPTTRSCYTRCAFPVTSAANILGLFIGADYDDGWVAWLNGVEVYRSPQMPAGAPAWDTPSALHESSNAAAPSYGTLVDISAAALPVLHDGTNVLAVGAWNAAGASSDLVLVPQLSASTFLAVTRGPYLQSGTPTSVVVRWRTSIATDSRVSFGPAPGMLISRVDDATLTTEHELQVTGLLPGQAVAYAVGTTSLPLAGDDARHVFVTPPLPGARQALRFWVVGDSGTADANARRVRDAYVAFTGPRRTDAWLMLGDNAYTDGSDTDYQAAVFDTYPDLLRSSVVWPTLGNHDAMSASSATQSGVYYDIFTLPRNAEAGGLASGTEAYYSFDWANIHFICLDSQDTDRSAGGPMLDWLAQDLAATSQQWVIAFWHHPPYTKGSHDSDTEGRHVDMRENALPLLESAGVDLVLSGHSHSYERSFLIDGHYGLSTTFGPANVVDAGDGMTGGTGAYRKPTDGLAPHEGAVYVVAGSSGKISGGPLDHPAMFTSMNVLGSLVLDVDGGRIDAKFLDDMGTWRDAFTLIKGPPPAEPDVVFRRADPFAEVFGNGDAALDPGETWSVDVELENAGGSMATAVVAGLRIAGATACAPTADYGTMAPGARVARAFSFVVDARLRCGASLAFDVVGKASVEKAYADELSAFARRTGTVTFAGSEVLSAPDVMAAADTTTTARLSPDAFTAGPAVSSAAFRYVADAEFAQVVAARLRAVVTGRTLAIELPIGAGVPVSEDVSAFYRENGPGTYELEWDVAARPVALSELLLTISSPEVVACSRWCGASCMGTVACPEEACGNAADDDGDGEADCLDPDCVSLDDDLDGHAACVDCAPHDVTAFAVPAEIPRLDVSKPGAPGSVDALLTWTDVRDLSGTGTVEDVASGRLSELWTDRGFARASCLANDLTAIGLTDARLVGRSSDGFYYLVRGEDACGFGSWGTDSTGAPRVLPPAGCD